MYSNITYPPRYSTPYYKHTKKIRVIAEDMKEAKRIKEILVANTNVDSNIKWIKPTTSAKCSADTIYVYGNKSDKYIYTKFNQANCRLDEDNYLSIYKALKYLIGE